MQTIIAILIYVPSIREGLAWYQAVFPEARLLATDNTYYILQVEQVNLEIVPADEKVPSGVAGTVVYWYTESFQASWNRLIKLGAVPFRGPMRIENNACMGQLKDPFGNVIGLRGPDC